MTATAPLTVIDIDGVAAQAVAADIDRGGVHATTFATAVTSSESVGDLVESAVEAYGDLPVVITHARGGGGLHAGQP
ncbi:hypothetical protein [Aeromicrobium sp.]|uniref:hypothetical protein n=1 Tax=Aeromicrobium sp. TaxID=1871063 RepID=UPI0019A7C0F7|nr:hypothetical protein [Aeromicrobium sp.]MBC7633365.1 hypothetical protein [Aeromicrobium sp.]